jgi:hypothetical protein
MRWFRRRSHFDPAQLHASTELVPRTERALVMLAVHAQQISDRVDRLERRLSDTEDTLVAAPVHDDLLEVRLHSARVAAELTKVTIELRAEIDELAAATTAENGDHTPPRARNLAKSILDLSDRLDTLPRDLRAG